MPRSKGPLIVAVVLGLLVLGAIKLWSSREGGEETPANGAPAVVKREGCSKLVVASSPEKQAVFQAVANDYNRSDRMVGDDCFEVTVNAVSSGAGEQALARGWDERVDGTPPDVWSPAASTWVTLLERDLTRRDRPQLVPDGKLASVTSTPLVLAMPRPMAEALGWPKAKIGWADVLTLAQDPRGWGAKGHPAWGKFTLGKTNPNLSTSGLAATIGAFVAATGKSSDLTMRDLADPRVRTFVAGVERSVVHYGDTTLTYLANLQQADEQGSGLGYVSAVAVEEKSVLDYNAGNPSGSLASVGEHKAPKVPLVAVYPKEGTLYSDSPYVVLDAPWSTDAKKKGAADFLEFLQRDDQQRAFTDVGFRTHDHVPGKAIKASKDVLADGVGIVLSPPGPEVLDAVRSAWTDLRKAARVLLLLDVSGSMSEAAGGGRSKLELAKEAATKALAQLADRDQVGLWIFTTDLDTKSGTTQELLPVRPLGDGHREEVEKSVRDLIPLQGTPLYSAIRLATQEMSASYASNRINAVVVLTDGRNEYSDDNDLDGLLRDLEKRGERPLRVFSIAYGEGADLATLRKISEASEAAAYDATDPANIDKVFTAVLSNF